MLHRISLHCDQVVFKCHGKIFNQDSMGSIAGRILRWKYRGLSKQANGTKCGNKLEIKKQRGAISLIFPFYFLFFFFKREKERGHKRERMGE